MRFAGVKIRAALILCTLVLASCAETFIEDPLGTTQALPLTKSPTPSFSDGFLGTASIALRRTVNLNWSASSGISSWCVSESQTTPPVLTCDGGQGADGGWSYTAPTSMVLSPGTAAKMIYTWVRDASGNLLPIPNVSAVSLINTSVLIPFNNGSGSLVSDISGLGFFFWMGSGGRWVNNRSIELDGSSSYVDLGVPSELRYTSSFTITGWVKSAQAGGQILVGRYDPGSSNKAYNLHFTSSLLQFEVSKDGSNTVGQSAHASANYTTYQFQNRWKHFAAVYESKTDGTSRVTLYIDGVKADESNTGPASILDPSSLKATVGISHDLASYPLKGQIGAMAFFPTPLSQTVIQALFLIQKPGYL